MRETNHLRCPEACQAYASLAQKGTSMWLLKLICWRCHEGPLSRQKPKETK